MCGGRIRTTALSQEYQRIFGRESNRFGVFLVGRASRSNRFPLFNTVNLCPLWGKRPVGGRGSSEPLDGRSTADGGLAPLVRRNLLLIERKEDSSLRKYTSECVGNRRMVFKYTQSVIARLREAIQDLSGLPVCRQAGFVEYSSQRRNI
jgi:hypothetical protein